MRAKRSSALRLVRCSRAAPPSEVLERGERGRSTGGRSEDRSSVATGVMNVRFAVEKCGFLLGAAVFRLSCAGGCYSNLRCIDFDANWTGAELPISENMSIRLTQTVADAVNCENVGRVLRVCLDLLSKCAYVHAKIANIGADIGVISPDCLPAMRGFSRPTLMLDSTGSMRETARRNRLAKQPVGPTRGASSSCSPMSAQRRAASYPRCATRARSGEED
jgi:hypothetical protein